MKKISHMQIGTRLRRDVKRRQEWRKDYNKDDICITGWCGAADRYGTLFIVLARTVGRAK